MENALVNNIVQRFGYHRPETEKQREAHAQVRSRFMELALKMSADLPEGRHKSLCLAKLEEACQAANAALALTHGDAIIDELDRDLLVALYQACYGTKPYSSLDREQLVGALKTALALS